jgi:hypothetical protein
MHYVIEIFSLCLQRIMNYFVILQHETIYRNET